MKLRCFLVAAEVREEEDGGIVEVKE